MAKEDNAELQAQLNAFEAEKAKFNEAQINFKREKLVSLGYPAKAANKLNSIESLDNLIVVEKDRLNEEEEKKKMEEEAEEEAEDQVSTKQVKKINSKNPSITMPDGKVVEAELQTIRFNGHIPQHLRDHRTSPRNVVLYRKNARICPLPRDEKHPYERVVC